MPKEYENYSHYFLLGGKKDLSVGERLALYNEVRNWSRKYGHPSITYDGRYLYDSIAASIYISVENEMDVIAFKLKFGEHITRYELV